MGRKRVPAEVRELAGARRDKLPKTRLTPPGPALREPPKWFNEKQRECWNEAIAQSPAGLLRRLDAKLLAVWVVATVTHQEAVEQLNKAKSLLVKTPNTKEEIQSPFLPIINRQAEIIMRCTSELGFSPTSRARIAGAAGDGKKDQNRFAGHAKRA